MTGLQPPPPPPPRKKKKKKICKREKNGKCIQIEVHVTVNALSHTLLQKETQLVSWRFEPGQPQRITSGLSEENKSNFRVSEENESNFRENHSISGAHEMSRITMYIVDEKLTHPKFCEK